MRDITIRSDLLTFDDLSLEDQYTFSHDLGFWHDFNLLAIPRVGYGIVYIWCSKTILEAWPYWNSQWAEWPCNLPWACFCISYRVLWKNPLVVYIQSIPKTNMSAELLIVATFSTKHHFSLYRGPPQRQFMNVVSSVGSHSIVVECVCSWLNNDSNSAAPFTAPTGRQVYVIVHFYILAWMSLYGFICIGFMRVMLADIYASFKRVAMGVFRRVE